MPINDELLEVKPEFMGFQMKDYPGAFPPKVEEKIRMTVESPCLHLFSGTSKIGDVRIDLARPEATLNMDVFEFALTDKRDWKFVLLDPVYDAPQALIRNGITKRYARYDSVAGNILSQRILTDFMRGHAENVLWFDRCSPCPQGFYRHKFWVYFGGGYRAIRALTWLKREGERLA